MKKINFIIGIVILILSLCVCTFSAGALSLGDLNADGAITAADARTILRAAADLITLSDEEFAAADINGDGLVKANDARIACRIVAELESIDEYTTAEVLPTEEETTAAIIDETTTIAPIDETTTAVPEETTVADEPVTPSEKKGNENAIKYLEEFGIEATISEAGATDTDITYATDGKNIYFGITADSTNLSILIKSELLGRTLNIINDKTQEYVSISQSLLNTFGMMAGESISIDSIVDDAMGDLNIIVPYLTSYAEADLPETELDGVTYGYYTKEQDEGGHIIMYFKQGETQISRLEYYNTAGNLVSSMTFNKVNADPSSYLKIPSSYNKISFSLTNLDKVMEFFEAMNF